MGALPDRVGREGHRLPGSLPSPASACIRYSGGERCTSCDRRALGSLDAPSNMECRRAANAAASCLLYHIISALICMCNASPFLSASRRRMIWRLRSRPTAAISMGVVR